MSCRFVPVLIFFFILTAPAAVAGEASFLERVAAIVQKHCPEAEIRITSNSLTAKHGTMMFDVHHRDMTGEISAESDRMEGPNLRGFLLTITIQEGRYNGQAIIPQTLREPYWQTFIHRPSTQDGTSHYVFDFSYGARTDPELKEAIFGLLSLSGSQFKDGVPVGNEG